MARISKIRELLKENEEVSKLDDAEIEKLEKQLEKELKAEEKDVDAELDGEEEPKEEGAKEGEEDGEEVPAEDEVPVEARDEELPAEDDIAVEPDGDEEVKEGDDEEVPADEELPQGEPDGDEVPAEDEDDLEKEFDLNDSSDVFLDDEEEAEGEKKEEEAVEPKEGDEEELAKEIEKELKSEEKEEDEDGEKKEVEEEKDKKKDEDEDEKEEACEAKKPSIDVEEHVKALFNGETLTEDFQNKARTIFEAAVREKVVQYATNLKGRYNKKLRAAKAKVEEKMVEKIDGYMNYVVEEWMQQNKLAVEHGLRTEITEEFLTDLRRLFETHNIMIPKGKENLVESLVDKLEKVEKELDEQVKKTIKVNKKLNEYKKNEAFRAICEGLADTEIERLKSLASNLQYDDSYTDKLQVIKENYLTQKTKKAASVEKLNDKKPEEKEEPLDPQMASYLSVLKKIR
jgi:hypothetical protein